MIRRQIDGERIVVSTRCHDERTALEHLRRFEADPRGYDPRGVAPAEALVLDEEPAKGYLDWSRDDAGNSREWRAKRAFLSWWAEELKGLDLRAGEPRCVSLRDHILPALRTPPRGTTGSRS